MAIQTNKSGTLKEIAGSGKQIWVKDCTGITCDNKITLPFLPEYTILLSTRTLGSTTSTTVPRAMLGISSTVNYVNEVPAPFVSSVSMSLGWLNNDKSTLKMKLSHSSGYGDNSRSMTFILIAIST